MKTGSKAKLQAQFNGVSSPSEMGTTGLIAWVLAGEQFNRWDRYKVAKKVIKSRCNSGWDMCKLIALFDRAILAAAEQHGINMERFKRATAPKANKVATVENRVNAKLQGLSQAIKALKLPTVQRV